MNTILDEWREYESKVIQPDAPPIQRRECCLAFYAGTLALMSLQINNIKASDSACDALAESWRDECSEIARKYARGEKIPC